MVARKKWFSRSVPVLSAKRVSISSRGFLIKKPFRRFVIRRNNESKRHRQPTTLVRLSSVVGPRNRALEAVYVGAAVRVHCSNNSNTRCASQSTSSAATISIKQKYSVPLDVNAECCGGGVRSKPYVSVLSDHTLSSPSRCFTVMRHSASAICLGAMFGHRGGISPEFYEQKNSVNSPHELDKKKTHSYKLLPADFDCYHTALALVAIFNPFRATHTFLGTKYVVEFLPL